MTASSKKSPFVQYTNKSSVQKQYTRYVQGGTTTILAIGLGWWDQRDNIPTNQPDDITFPVTREFAYCPDKISYVIYGRPDLAWLILQYNEIVDIMEELTAGTTISIPSPTRAFTDILTNPLPSMTTTSSS